MEQIESKQAETLLLEGENSTKHVCLNCGNEYEGSFCPKCGQSAKVSRINLKRVLTESLPDIYNLDNRFVRTVVDLFRRPGHMIHDYIDGKRVQYYKPVSLLFVLAAIYLIVAHLLNIRTEEAFNPEWLQPFDINGQMISIIPEGSIWAKIIEMGWNVMQNKAWSLIIFVTLFIYPMKIAFCRTDMGKKLNLAEYFMILVYVRCQVTVLDIIELPFIALWGSHNAFSGNNAAIPLLLMGWTIKQLYNIGWHRSLRLYCIAWILFILFATITITAAVCLAYAFGLLDGVIAAANNV